MTPIGVTTRKKIIPIINGEIIFPNNIPKLNHILFKGFNNLELVIPRRKKIIEKNIDQYLISFVPNKGHKPIIKKKYKKN